MNELQMAVLKRANDYNFQLLTSNPNKLQDYVFNKIINPMVDDVIKVRDDFYNVNFLLDGIEIMLVDKKIKLQAEQGKFSILEDKGDGLWILLSVVFKNEIGYVNLGKDRFDEDVIEQLTNSHLTNAIKRIF
ncbi:hypothetical protein [Lysinibacillus parviboronicapiens]|uniref:hypothetical protein n=1 Tax=Lysinibacillus parviboronicapiens TaxID=436516 RepID=UPI000D371597|nr:hypothetical protein [Lysinibacillus parviboronicapiens]